MKDYPTVHFMTADIYFGRRYQPFWNTWSNS